MAANVKFEDGGMYFQALLHRGDKWIKIDDLIAWLKKLQELNESESELFHELIKSAIKMKNNHA